MLTAGIIINKEHADIPLQRLSAIEGIQWKHVCLGEGLSSGINSIPTGTVLFSGAETLPMLCDILVILDKEYCNFDFLAHAIRNSCHLFISDTSKLSFRERKQLISLAMEGGSSLQVMSDSLYHPLTLEMGVQANNTKQIEICNHQRNEEVFHTLREDLVKLFYTVKAPIKRCSVSGMATSESPLKMVNVHLEFTNGAVAGISISNSGCPEAHYFKYAGEDNFYNFDYKKQVITDLLLEKEVSMELNSEVSLLEEQIKDFSQRILTHRPTVYSIEDELRVHEIVETAKDKLRIRSLHSL